MAFDHGFWASHFRERFASQIIALVKVFEERFLPTFTGLEEESERLANEEFTRLGQLPGDEYTDMADLAESAQEVGLAHYELMTDVRQAFLNLIAAALYHLFEQQLLSFHRRQVLHPAEEDDARLFALHVLQARLAAVGVRLVEFPSWAKIKEMRLVANTVKHAEGRSTEELSQLRPELFVPPIIRGTTLGNRRFRASVYGPLMGDDIYVEMKDIQDYRDAAVSFWSELAASISALQ